MASIGDAIARKNRQNPQFDYLWRVELPDLTLPTGDVLAVGLFNFLQEVDSTRRSQSSLSGLASSIGSGVLDALGGMIGRELSDIQELNHRVYSVSTPFASFESERHTKGVTFSYSAGHSDIGSLSMTIDEMEDGKTLEYIEQWMSLIEPNKWTRNVPAVYKRDIKYIKMGSSKLDLHYSVYKGYFPTDISPIDSNYDSNGVMQYNVTFTGDSVDHVIIPESIVASMTTASEFSILKQQFLSNKFKSVQGDTLRATKVLSNILSALG